MGIINSKDQIKAACQKFGTANVYYAAKKRLAGDHGALPAVGLLDSTKTDDAKNIMNVAFKLMDGVALKLDLPIKQMYTLNR